MRIFVDANILFSAADPDSATRSLLIKAAKKAELVTSPHAWEESRRNLEAKRPRLLRGLDGLKKCIELSSAFDEVEKIDLPDYDLPILSGAKGARCSHLWTGDKRHFGRFYGKRLSGVLVISSLALADVLTGKRNTNA